MKCYYLGDKKITEAEAKEIEAKNREILRDGTVFVGRNERWNAHLRSKRN